MDNQHCRFCGQKLKHTFVDLGLSPLANEYLREEDLDKGHGDRIQGQADRRP